MPAGFSAEHRPRERYLTVEELQKLLPQLLPEKTAVVAFIIATAADWSAVGRALRADVAIDGTGCTIRGSKNEYRRNRVVPIATHEQRTLIRYALEHADGEPPKK
jgi:integrase